MIGRWMLGGWGIVAVLAWTGAASKSVEANANLVTNAQVVEVPPDGTVHYHHFDLATGVQTSAASTVAGGGEAEPLVGTVVYRNIPDGGFALAPAAGVEIADDLTTVALDGCDLSGLELRYTGGGDGTGPGFQVDIAMYDDCPNNGRQLIPGTAHTLSFTDDGAHVALIDLLEAPVPVPSTVWLGSTFSRNGAGWFVGSAADVGYTDNFFDHVSPPCEERFAGTDIFAGFHARLHCIGGFPREYLTYANRELSAHNNVDFTPGAGQWMADDISLATDFCEMTSFEIAGRSEAGPYTVDAEIWRVCNRATLVQGTQRSATGLGDGSPEVFRFDIPGGLTLPTTNLWVAWRYNAADVRAIVSGPAELGVTDDFFGLWEFPDPNECGLFFFGGFPSAGFRIAVRCAGEPSRGACCDLAPVVEGQPDAQCSLTPQVDCTGEYQRWSEGDACPGRCFVTDTPCTSDDDCQTCSESDTPCLVNEDCPQGETCENDEFCGATDPFDPPCGTAACCTPPNAPNGEGCENLPQADCEAILDVDGNPAVWQPGRVCDEGPQGCIPWTCRFSDQSCLNTHNAPGCDNASCCAFVCNLDAFCCDIQWDATCVQRTQQALEDGDCAPPVPNDVCASALPGTGAQELMLEQRCSGPNPIACTTSADCDRGESCRWLDEFTQSNEGATAGPDEAVCCSDNGPGSGHAGLWYKFQAQPRPGAPETEMLTSAQIDTCETPSDGGMNSVLQVFDANGHTMDIDACPNLTPITCTHDGCENGNFHGATVCVQNLTVGDWYYVLLDSPQISDSSGLFTLRVESPCPVEVPIPLRDRCDDPAVDVQPGSYAYDLRGASFTCPGANCVSDVENDVWFRVTPASDGLMTVQTCVFEMGSPTDTSLVVYETVDCPPAVSDIVLPDGCNDDAPSDCAIGGSRTSLIVMGGVSYTIRIGGKDGSEPFGTLDIFLDADCNGNGRSDADDIACGFGNECDGIPGSADCDANSIPDECQITEDPTLDCDGNNRPDSCDLADDPDLDCDGNGRIDSCDIADDPDLDTNGDGVLDSCESTQSIPTVSTWGLMVLALLLMIAGKLAWQRRALA